MSKNHWSAYWDTGVLTSLPSDFKENYDGELLEYWKSVLLTGKSPSRILDVCTGNGAVAILLSSIATDHDLNIELVAVDASDINPKNVIKVFPGKSQQVNKIQFIGNCLVEEMTATIEGKFDLVVSQYGIEYCDTQKAASNVADILEKDGRFVFVSHSPNTAILDYMRTEQDIFKFLESLNLFEICSQYSRDKMTSNSFKNKLEKSLQLMSQQNQFKSHQLFNIWGQTIYQLFQMKNADLKQQQSKIGSFSQMHFYAMKRAEDMLRVSEKLINDENWYQPYEDAGLKLQKHGEITYRGKHNVGHFYEFIKS